MPIGVIVAFIVVFGLIMIAVSVGLKFFDARRKRQVADMLQTASGEPVVTVANLLKELEPEKKTGIKAIIGSLHFSRHAQEMIQQAGLNWTATRLISAMGLMTIPGAGIGLMAGGPAGCVLGALVFGILPYVFVRKKRTKRLDALEEQFPEALDFLARSMRAGHAFSITL